MRLKTIGIAVICLMSACTGQQKTETPAPVSIDRAGISMVLNEQVLAWNQGNLNGFMEGYWHSDSLRFIGKRGINRGYDSVSARYKRNYSSLEKMGHLDFENLEYTLISEQPVVVNVTGKWHINGKDSASGFFSLLMQSIKGEWKITTDHTW